MFYILQKQVILQLPDVYFSMCYFPLFILNIVFSQLVRRFTWKTTLDKHFDHYVILLLVSFQ